VDSNFFSPALGGTPDSGLAPAIGGAKAGVTCKVCQRPLTSPESRTLGVGPVCAVRSGDTRLEVGPYKVHGTRGTTADALHAFTSRLDRKRIRRLVLVSFNEPDGVAPHVYSHGFLFETEGGRYEVIADGFASGYGGTGPHGLAKALQAADTRGLPDAPKALELDAEHASALFNGHLDPHEIMHLARPLTVAPSPALGDWATYVPGAAPAIAYRPAPVQGRLL
jgi:hypothetical protein